MAVKGESAHNPTEGLILSQPRRHFKTSVRTVHWQLRSLLSAERPNTLYFPAGSDSNPHIQKLNTTTCETETAKLLPFQPRCLVARNRWVCCGGEHGEFAAVHLDEEDNSSDLDLRQVLGSGLRSPLGGGGDSAQIEESIYSILASSRSDKTLVAKSKKFGKERVNCITMWFPPSIAKPVEGAYTTPIAVLANNDRTVTLVNLDDQEALDCLPYPDCVNRAVVSPDGRLLIAISDDPYLYVHERCEKQPTSAGAPRSTDSHAFEWRPSNRIHLQSQKKDDKTDNRGSFAACFSSTGAYLAVGTQYGTISIFDPRTLAEPDVESLITSFTSSRPNAELGAVRDMAFAPGPIDLLAWTEDRGRVGVADLRSGFLSRQTLELDVTDAFDHITIIDTSSIDPRLLDQRSNRGDPLAPLASLANDLYPSTETPPPHSSDAPANTSSIERYNHPLTADETMVLEALQDHGRRRAQRAAAAAPTTSGSAPRFSWMERASRPTIGPDSPASRERSASVSRAVNEIMGNLRDQRERLRDSQERLRAVVREESEAERRRSAAMPTYRRAGAPRTSTTTTTAAAPAAAASAGGSTESSTASAAEIEARASRRTLSRLVANNPTAFGGWVDLEVLHNYAFDSPPPAEADGRRRERAAYLRRDLDPMPYRRTHGAFMSREGGPDPFDTAGMSWSEDGQTLYVGADNGIYEFRVNMFRRRFFTSTTLQ